MKFIIRDDDTCGFTRVEEIEKCYKSILPYAPVCLSVTPFRISREGDSFSHNNILYEPYPLDKNPELVSYLKENIVSGQIEVSLHGYHHFIQPDKGPQETLALHDSRFQNKEYLYGTDLEEKTIEGKKYLEEVLNCRVTTFVPPSNSISKKGITAIARNSLNLVTTIPLWSISKRPFDFKNYTNFIKTQIWKLSQELRYFPFTLDFNSHKEIVYFSLTPQSSFEKLKNFVRAVHKCQGIFVLATHYQAFNKKIKSGETVEETLNKLLEETQKLESVEFVKYKDIWN